MKRAAYLDSLFREFKWTEHLSGPFIPIMHVNLPLGPRGLGEWLADYGEVAEAMRSGRPLVMIDYEPPEIGQAERETMRQVIDEVRSHCEAELTSRKMQAATRVGVYGTERTWFADGNCGCLKRADVKVLDCYRHSTQSVDRWASYIAGRVAMMRQRFGATGVMPLFCPTSFVDRLHETMPPSDQVATVTVAHRLWRACKTPAWFPGFWAGAMKIDDKTVRCRWDPASPWVMAVQEIFA